MVFGFRRTERQADMAPTEPLTHEVAGRALPLTVRRHARATRMTLRIDPGGRGLKVTVPPGVGEAEVRRFVARHNGWIEGKLDLVPDEAQLRVGHKVPVRGVPHVIVHETGRGTTRLGTHDDQPAIFVHGDTRFAARRVADHLKKLAKADIEPLVTHHAAKVGKTPRSVRFKDTKSRWGSCSSDANLSFSWRIMMAPPSVINYLVAHEVAHLVHMDHSVRFWALTETLCPDMKRAKDWLKRNGTKLQAIGFG